VMLCRRLSLLVFGCMWSFFEKKLREFPDILFVWVSNQPQHYVPDVHLHRTCVVPSEPTHAWAKNDSYFFRQKEKEIFHQLFKHKNFLFFDPVMSLYRYDAHPGKDVTINFGGDCTHFCLPGVPDFWSAVLAQHYCYFVEHRETVFSHNKRRKKNWF